MRRAHRWARGRLRIAGTFRERADRLSCDEYQPATTADPAPVHARAGSARDSRGNAGPLPSFLDPLGGPDAKRQVWGLSAERAFVQRCGDQPGIGACRRARRPDPRRLARRRRRSSGGPAPARAAARRSRGPDRHARPRGPASSRSPSPASSPVAASSRHDPAAARGGSRARGWPRGRRRATRRRPATRCRTPAARGCRRAPARCAARARRSDR